MEARDGRFEIPTTIVPFGSQHLYRQVILCGYHNLNVRKGILQVSTSLFAFSTSSSPPPDHPSTFPRFQMMNKLVRVTERPQEPRYGDTPALRALLIEINPSTIFPLSTSPPISLLDLPSTPSHSLPPCWPSRSPHPTSDRKSVV